MKKQDSTPAADGSLGTSSLKDLIKFIIIATQKVLTVDTNQNGRISLVEAFAAMTAIGFKIPGVTKALPQVLPEWRDLTKEERDDLVRWFAEEFDLPGIEKGKIEALIEECIAIILDTDTHVRRIQAILG